MSGREGFLVNYAYNFEVCNREWSCLTQRARRKFRVKHAMTLVENPWFPATRQPTAHSTIPSTPQACTAVRPVGLVWHGPKTFVFMSPVKMPRRLDSVPVSVAHLISPHGEIDIPQRSSLPVGSLRNVKRHRVSKNWPHMQA